MKLFSNPLVQIILNFVQVYVGLGMLGVTPGWLGTQLLFSKIFGVLLLIFRGATYSEGFVEAQRLSAGLAVR